MMQQFQTKGDTPGGTPGGPTAGGMISGKEEWYGDLGEITTPTGNEDTPNGNEIYLEDLPLDYILDQYGIEMYKDEYKHRFSRKPNMDIFRNIAHENFKEKKVKQEQESIPIFGLRKTESIQENAYSQINNGMDKISNLEGKHLPLKSLR